MTVHYYSLFSLRFSGDYLHTNTLHMSCRDQWLEEFDSSAIFSRVFFGKDSSRIAWYPERRRKSNINHQAELKIISRFFLSAAPCRSLCNYEIRGTGEYTRVFLRSDRRYSLNLKLYMGFLDDTIVIILNEEYAI